MACRNDTPASLTITPSQQAEVARSMEENGLDPTEFTWAVQPSRFHLIGPLVSALVHTPTGASFRFEFIDSAIGQNRVSVFVPRESAHEVTKTAASWEEQLAQVCVWLEQVARAR
jgi:hypothetical protein